MALNVDGAMRNSKDKLLKLIPVDRYLKKKYFGNDIQKKWQSLRNCFARELRNQKNCKSGDGAKKRRKYIYFDKLLFLLPMIENRETKSNLVTDLSESDADVENDTRDQEAATRGQMKRQSSNRIRKTNYEEELLKILQKKAVPQTEVDEDINFAMSIVPMLKSLDDYSKMDAKIQILSLLKNIRWSGSNQEYNNNNNQTRSSFPSYPSDIQSIPGPSKCQQLNHVQNLQNKSGQRTYSSNSNDTVQSFLSNFTDYSDNDSELLSL